MVKGAGADFILAPATASVVSQGVARPLHREAALPAAQATGKSTDEKYPKDHANQQTDENQHTYTHLTPSLFLLYTDSTWSESQARSHCSLPL